MHASLPPAHVRQPDEIIRERVAALPARAPVGDEVSWSALRHEAERAAADAEPGTAEILVEYVLATYVKSAVAMAKALGLSAKTAQQLLEAAD